MGNKQKKRPTLQQWNVPDWVDGSAYPDPNTTNLAQWKWEFLRRRKDYRDDWLAYAPHTYEQQKKEYRSAPFIEFRIGKRTIRRKKDKPFPPQHLDAVAYTPTAFEKYGMHGLFNPNNPQPKELWIFAQSPLIDWSAPGEGKMTDVFGLNMILSKTEVVLKFDLSKAPIDRMMGDLNRRFPLPNLEEGDSTEIRNLRKMLLYVLHTDRPKHIKNSENYIPRIIEVVQRPYEALVIFDLSIAFWSQWKEAKKWLMSLQIQKGYKFKTPNLHPEKWGRYLRVLDAKAAGLPNKEIIERIGKEIFSDCKGSNAYISLNRFFKSAERLQHNFPVLSSSLVIFKPTSISPLHQHP